MDVSSLCVINCIHLQEEKYEHLQSSATVIIHETHVLTYFTTGPEAWRMMIDCYWVIDIIVAVVKVISSYIQPGWN